MANFLPFGRFTGGRISRGPLCRRRRLFQIILKKGLTIFISVAGMLSAGLEVRAQTAVPLAEVTAREINGWPVSVYRPGNVGAGRADARRGGLGPFVFSTPAGGESGGTARGIRPFWVEFRDPAGGFRSAHILYPLFNYAEDGGNYRWSLLELVRREGRLAGAAAPEVFDARHRFEVTPFWFEREFEDATLNYRALFPVLGTVRQKFGLERASWVFFPFFAEVEERSAVTTYAPWPFVRTTRGAARGWGVWPLYSTVERPGEMSETHVLWPLGHDRVRQPDSDDPAGTAPRRETAFLPFFSRSTGPGYVNETFVWPLFGYTERTAPVRYSEQRYFWPLLVQGRGDEAYINRWAPFYSHSVIKGQAKWWYLWPLARHMEWTEEGVDRSRSQLLYFLYWHESQRAAGRSDGPAATLTHVWPLFSHWEDGRGRRQWQLLSPLEVFLPGNVKVRQAWSPLFALARHEGQAGEGARTSLLWDAVTWEHRPRENRSEFHLGPLFSSVRAGDARRLALGNGLLGLERDARSGWKFFALRFSSPPSDGL